MNPGIPKLELSAVKKLFAKHGCVLLEDEYTNSKSPMLFKCRCGKKRVTCVNNFYRKKLPPNQCVCGLQKESKRELKKRIMIRQDRYNMSEAARLINVHYGDFYSHVKKNMIPAPARPLKYGHTTRLYYSRADIAKIEAKLFPAEECILKKGH